MSDCQWAYCTAGRESLPFCASAYCRHKPRCPLHPHIDQTFPWVLGIQRNRNGRFQYMQMCELCGRKVRALKKARFIELTGSGATVKFFIDTIDESTKCVVRNCKNLGYEFHHFAPSNIFGWAAEDFPKRNLCVEHHSLWHKKMDRYSWDEKDVACDFSFGLCAIKRYPKGEWFPDPNQFRCRNTNVALLRLAPRSIFEDSDDWPKVYACEEHHYQWHSTLNGYRRNGKSVGYDSISQ